MKTHKFFLLLLSCLCAFVIPLRAAVRHFTIADGLPNNQVRQIIELPNRQVLVATEGMFSLYNGRNFVPLVCNLDSVHVLPSFGGHDALWQGDSLLWLRDFYYLYLFDARERRFRYDYDRFLKSPAVKRFISKVESEISDDRRQRLQPHWQVSDSVVQASGLRADVLTAYLLDRQGGQWFGLREEGICYLPPQSNLVHLTKLDNGETIRRMVDIDGRLMLIGGERGIYEYDSQRQCVVRTLATGEIFTHDMSRDSRGRIWISTTWGLYAYVHGELLHYDQYNTSGFIHCNMRFACPIDERRLLVCNLMHQLGYFYPEEHRVEVLNGQWPVLDSYRTMIAAQPLTNRNHVVVCTQNGLFVLDASKDKILQTPLTAEVGRYSRKYNCILRDRSGRTWIGTQNGLLVVTGDTAIVRLSHADGLSNNCILSMTEDTQGCIWTATAGGVNRIRMGDTPHDVHIRSLGTDDGFPDAEFTERGACLMPDGMLYLASPVGLVSFPVEAFQSPVRPDSLVLVGLRVAEIPQSLDTLPLRLNHKQNYIEVQVSPLNYAHPHLAVYRCRLIGLEEEWRYLEGDAGLLTIRYSGLAPGHYTLQVQASSGDDIWGPVLSKVFHISPPLWLTWWAKSAYVLLSFLLLVAGTTLYLRDRRRKLERENEERVNRLFALREEASRQFAQSVEVDPQVDGTGDGEGDKLVERVMEAITKNMGDCNYTIDQLAQDVGMSRANLYKKMQSQLGITPNDFVRNVRLKHAARLLEETHIPVSQLALMVGFQTPRYFSQCFRQTFGITPSQYRGTVE